MSVTEHLPSAETLSFRHFKNRSIWLGLTLMLVSYLVLAIAFSQVTPFNKGPDEGLNLDYIEFIAANGRLPINYEEREALGPKSNWPPLYHLLVVWTSNLFKVDVESPPQIKIFWDSFRYRAIDIEEESTWYLLTEDQQWPYYGRILILHIGRWLSVLCSLVTLVLVYITILELLPDRPWLALTASAILAFIPAYVFIGSVLNEDALVAALAALYFWMLIRVIKQPDKLWPYWVMGLALGLSVVVKYTTIILPLEVVLVVAIVAHQKNYNWYWWLGRVVIVGGSALVASSWWFGWNFWYLNEIEELGLISGLVRPIFTGGTDVTLARLGNFFSGGQIGLTDLPANTQVGTFWGWIQETFLSFWAVKVGGEIPLSPYAYIVVGLLIVIAAFGLWRLWQGEISSRPWLVLMMAHVGLFFILPLVRFGLSRRLGQTAQGRHILIPAAAAIVGLLVWGLVTATPKRLHRWVFPAIIGGLIVWTGAHLYRLNTFSAPLLPLRTLPEAAKWLPHPANVQFGDKVVLVSYDISPAPERGLLHLELAWRPLSHINENYLLQVELVDATGRVVSHWLGYNGHGRLPTLSWDPGDSIFDRLSLPLPNLAAGAYTVQIQLLSRGGPLAISGSRENQQDDTSLSLGKIVLEQPTAITLSNKTTINAEGLTSAIQISFDMWQTDGRTETTQYPLYRYPATITILASASQTNEAELVLQVVDQAGHVWPATQSMGGIYNFVIGPRWESGDYRIQMMFQEDSKVIGQVTTTEPQLKVVNWWKRHFEMPEIAVPMQANFANQLKFLGYMLPQNRVKAGETFPITLYWQAPPDMSPQANFIQFNHLLDSAGMLWGGYDRRPLEYYSTLLWAPGEIVIDGYAVPVDADAPPGEYYLDVGYYLTVGESAVNLPLVINGEMSQISSVTIGPIEVVAP